MANQNDSFIDEVTEDLRRDRLFGLYRRYGWIALAPFASEDPYREFTYINQLDNGRVTRWYVQPLENGLQITVNSSASASPDEPLQRAVSAAEPMASPLPMAAVVFPTASSLSVIFLTSGGR